jgi:hypothetical protein
MAKLNQKYFGNRNVGSASTVNDNEIGGEGVASITLGGVNNSSGYALYDPIEISAPTLPGGVQATARVSQLGASNKILAIEVIEKGSGYTAAPTVTENVGGVQGTLTFTAVLTNSQEQSIYTYAKTTSGGTSKLADIIKQRSTKRFKVKTADGTAICMLKGSAVSAVGEMTIIAQDSAGGTYYITKIGSRRCTVTRGTGTQFATDSSVAWTFGPAVLNTSVQIDNA